MTEKLKLSLNMDSMKFRELELFEDVTGRSLDNLVRMKPVIDPETGKPTPDPDDPKGRPLMQAEMTTKALIAMVLIARQREDKSVTLDEVREMSIDEIDFEVETADEDDGDPTPGDETPEPEGVDQADES